MSSRIRILHQHQICNLMRPTILDSIQTWTTRFGTGRGSEPTCNACSQHTTKGHPGPSSYPRTAVPLPRARRRPAARADQRHCLEKLQSPRVFLGLSSRTVFLKDSVIPKFFLWYPSHVINCDNRVFFSPYLSSSHGWLISLKPTFIQCMMVYLFSQWLEA